MPHNKKHHYVPRFLLKRFSTDGKSINLYHIPSKRKVIGAGLYNQCYKNYMYGRDQTIENALALSEGEIAKLLRRMDEVLVPPPPMSSPYDTMLFFVLTQKGRTVYASEAMDESLDKMLKIIYGHIFTREGIDPSAVKIGFKEPGAYILGLNVSCYPLLYDLDYMTIVNDTKEEFVISDNPVVSYNLLMNFGPPNGNTGFASKGLLLFVPLDPKKTLVMFDRDVYKVGKDKDWVVHINNPQDVYELNALQFVSAESTIYFRDDEFRVEPLHKKAAPFLRKQRSEVQSFEQPREGKRRSMLVTTASEAVDTNLSLSFISIRMPAKEWRTNFKKQRLVPAAVVRNKKLVSAHKEFMKAVERGEYQGADFKAYVAAKLAEEEKVRATQAREV